MYVYSRAFCVCVCVFDVRVNVCSVCVHECTFVLELGVQRPTLGAFHCFFSTLVFGFPIEAGPHPLARLAGQ